MRKAELLSNQLGIIILVLLSFEYSASIQILVVLTSSNHHGFSYKNLSFFVPSSFHFNFLLFLSFIHPLHFFILLTNWSVSWDIVTIIQLSWENIIFKFVWISWVILHWTIATVIFIMNVLLVLIYWIILWVLTPFSLNILPHLVGRVFLFLLKGWLVRSIRVRILRWFNLSASFKMIISLEAIRLHRVILLFFITRRITKDIRIVAAFRFEILFPEFLIFLLTRVWHTIAIVAIVLHYLFEYLYLSKNSLKNIYFTYSSQKLSLILKD